MPIDAVDLLRDLEFLEDLGLIEVDLNGDDPRFWPTEQGHRERLDGHRQAVERAAAGVVDVEGV